MASRKKLLPLGLSRSRANKHTGPHVADFLAAGDVGSGSDLGLSFSCGNFGILRKSIFSRSQVSTHHQSVLSAPKIAHDLRHKASNGQIPAPEEFNRIGCFGCMPGADRNRMRQTCTWTFQTSQKLFPAICVPAVALWGLENEGTQATQVGVSAGRPFLIPQGQGWRAIAPSRPESPRGPQQDERASTMGRCSASPGNSQSLRAMV
jgi:hypothetical protein